MKKIFIWDNTNQREWHVGVAMCEDGHVLAQHCSSSIGFCKQDMGLFPDVCKWYLICILLFKEVFVILLDIAFGQVIKKHREIQGLTQDQLADMLNVSRATIVYYENGKQSPSLETAVRASNLLGFNLADVVKTLSEIEKKQGINAVPENQREAIEKNLEAHFSKRNE